MPHTVAQCLNESARLIGVSDSPQLDTQLLLCHVLKKDRSWLYAWPDKKLSDVDVQQFVTLLEARAQAKPLAYILGQQEFWSLLFYVDSSTLIPRPDTERLVEVALEMSERLSSGVNQKRSLIDLGTGSGAIAIAFASERPDWTVTGSDISDDALEIFQKNIARHHLHNVKMLKSDWLARAKEKFSIVVSNPPYIDQNDEHLADDVRAYEPMSALISADDGFADLKKIICQAKHMLEPGGYLCLEHGWRQGESVRELFQREGYNDISSYRDLNKNERVTAARWQS